MTTTTGPVTRQVTITLAYPRSTGSVYKAEAVRAALSSLNENAIVKSQAGSEQSGLVTFTVTFASEVEIASLVATAERAARQWAMSDVTVR